VPGARIAAGHDDRVAGLDEAGRDAGVVRGHADADGAADEEMASRMRANVRPFMSENLRVVVGFDEVILVADVGRM